jgi:hypothetical protein
VVSLVSKLKSFRLIFCRPDKALGNKRIKNAPFVRLQIYARSIQ